MVPEEVYNRINNNIYNDEGEKWWQPDFSLNLLRKLYNPFRVGYIKLIIERTFIKLEGITVLEVGCGGGILLEEVARIGCIATGIDPAELSLKTARVHANENQLDIQYENASGELLPFPNCSFDVVLCCDVLEHVKDLPKVIAEISRVLKNDGVFIYDTINRTCLSKIGMIKIMQEWKCWAIMPPNLHVWKMFIKPEEIKSLLLVNGFRWKEHKGIEPDISYLKMLYYFSARASGKLTYEEFGRKFKMVESRSTRIMYMGHAVKHI
jgi:2-polyprenyl-6-hydroxyphenyl methylase/3-demethylubiquinone-9 3-methyltransferase